jgi:hypothetical protein
VQPTGVYFTRYPSGYYGLLTAGFRDGQLSVKLQPAPGLLALKDPYDPVANAPYRAHDMTLWKGKYYLYYGVAPLLVTFLPFSVLTGWYPTEECIVALCCSVGLVAGLALLLAMRRHFFPGAPGWALGLSVAVLILGSPVAKLVEAVQFYQVPIASAFAFHLLMLGAIYQALCGRAGSWVWLMVASCFYGLSIGARPNYLLSGGVLALAWVVLVWRSRSRGVIGRAIALGVAAFGPAVVAGLGLLFYNWLRFGVPTEFGIKYTLGGERIPNIKLMGLEYIWPHLGDYLFERGNWGRYFPFFSPPVGVPPGALRYAPWLWLIPAALVLRGSGERRGRAALAGSFAIATGANLLLLSFFFGLTDRYAPDFVPAALVAAGMGALALGERVRKMRVAAWVGGVLAGSTIFFAGAAWMKRFPDQARLLPLARLADTPTFWWEQWRGEVPGGLRLELELPRKREGLSEPLVHTGVAGDTRDWLQIEYLAGDRARLGFFHAGLGLLRGREFVIPTDRRITLELESGALLPPAAHPMFKQWSPFERVAAQRRLRVRVDGNDVLEAAMNFYESTPEDVVIGQMRWIGGGLQPAFTGKITKVKKMPVRRQALPRTGPGTRTPMELKLWFPADRMVGRDPLVTTGSGEKSDVIYCEYAGLGRASFGIYHYGYDTVASPIVAVDPLVAHTLQVWVGALADLTLVDAEDSGIPNARRLTLVLDGKVILNQEQVFYPATPKSVVLGETPFAIDVVGQMFHGRIEAVKALSFDILPDPGLMRQYGAVDMTVLFTRAAKGAAEPLVVTGVPGAGDFIYVRYLENDKLLFGFDHWGIGGLVGKPVVIDLWKPHRLRITMGSLYPPSEDVGEWCTRVEVQLDETVVLEGTYTCHPSTRTQIRIGENSIGGSTCGPRFSGQIQKIERPARPAW